MFKTQLLNEYMIFMGSLRMACLFDCTMKSILSCDKLICDYHAYNIL